MKNKTFILIGLVLIFTVTIVYFFSHAFYKIPNEDVSHHRAELKNKLIAKSLNDKIESEDRKSSQVKLFEIMEKSDIPLVIKSISPSLPLEESIGIVDRCLSLSQISTSYNIEDRGPAFIRKEIAEHVAKVIGNKDEFSLEWMDLDHKNESELIIYASKFLRDKIEKELSRATFAVSHLVTTGNALAFEQAIDLILSQSALSSDRVDTIFDFMITFKPSNEHKKFAAYIRGHITEYAGKESTLMHVAERLEKNE